MIIKFISSSIVALWEVMVCPFLRSPFCWRHSSRLTKLCRRMFGSFSSWLFSFLDLRCWRFLWRKPFQDQDQILHHASKYRLRFICQSCPSPFCSLSLLDRQLFLVTHLQQFPKRLFSNTSNFLCFLLSPWQFKSNSICGLTLILEGWFFHIKPNRDGNVRRFGLGNR